MTPSVEVLAGEVHSYLLKLVQLMGGLTKRYANKDLTTFAETLEAFLTGISYKFFRWLQDNEELFAEHQANRGFVWG